MALQWYFCRSCKTLVKQDSYPSRHGCPTGGQHSWDNLAEVGDNNWQCKSCGITIQAKSSPSRHGCPGGGQHSWHQL